MKIGIIDNYDSFTYNLVHYLEDISGDRPFVYMNDAVNWNELDTCTSLVLSPGPGLPKRSGQLMEVINRYYQQKKILGVCLGMQAIVEFFGGKLKNLNEVKHGVQNKIIVEKNPGKYLYKDIPNEIEVGRYHSWVADESNFPGCLEITAKDEDGNIMSIQHQTLPVYAVQYHPESVMTAFGKKILQNWVNMEAG